LSHSTDPHAREIKAAAVSKGGRARARPDGIRTWAPRDIATMEDLRALLSELVNAGMVGDVPTARLSSIAAVANALSKVIEGSELEARIEALEAKVGGKA
jgi:hypothetical protein